MKKEKKNNKGITLVALVVTIVVLIILAGVSLSVIIGNNGVIAKATEAKNKTAQAQKNEEGALADAEDWMEEQEGTKLPSTDTTKPYRPTGCTMLANTDLITGLVIQDSKGNQYVWVEVPKTEEAYPTAGLEITEFNDEECSKIEKDLHTYTSYYRESDYSDEWQEKGQYELEKDEYYTLKNKC